MEPPNVLLLDEPTNDLDVDTLTILEDYLESFPGIVLAVSHDRYILDKIAHSIFEVCRGGEVRQYTGNFSDYLDKRVPAEKAERVKTEKTEKAQKPANKPQKLKFSFNEQREFDHIDEELEQLAAKIETCEQQIAGAANDYVKLQELLAQKEELERQQEYKMERWVYLNELAEKIAAQNEKA